MEDISFRRVKATDYDQVLAIRENVYSGMDYLPALFHSMMETHEGFVAVHEDKMIAFQFVSVYDGGKTMFPRAGRISQEYEGKGVYRKLDEYVQDQYRGNIDIIRKGYSFGDHRLLKRVTNGEATLVLERKPLTFQIDISSVKEDLLSKGTSQQVNEINKKSMLHFLETMTTDTKSKLFPEQRLMMDWVPYRLINSNLDLIFRDYTILFESGIESSGDPTLTVGTYYKCGDVLRYNIDIHGCVADTFYEHVQKHLITAVKQDIEKIVIIVYFDKTIDICKIREVFDKFDIAPVDPPEYYTLYCIEEPFQRK